ncbi:MAG: hypothetical protein N0C81_19235 [Candidatus Thiodiazotropha lotti]|nr:hypothetical protein [Candidatus Thiodiazotropha lotti]MCG7922380.1 hypothetical protein [Candidatus Thiodiazotropha lotti]MCG7930703.1 hypothetical protein [Candidatus Thiodiazotropha lotti]MCG8003583.1 hypothetical protein [Candidatus Thiodiazotropha lotti]MCG8009763.1 hypothetical protein [Candidatus Thiodiazotropha lotti]
MADSAGGIGGTSGGSGIGVDSGMGGGSDSSTSESIGGLNSGVSGIGNSLEDSKTSCHNTTGSNLANSPTTADSLSLSPTTADLLSSAPTKAEQLSTAPTTATQLAGHVPAPNDNSGLIKPKSACRVFQPWLRVKALAPNGLATDTMQPYPSWTLKMCRAEPQPKPQHEQQHRLPRAL